MLHLLYSNKDDFVDLQVDLHMSLNLLLICFDPFYFACFLGVLRKSLYYQFIIGKGIQTYICVSFHSSHISPHTGHHPRGPQQLGQTPTRPMPVLRTSVRRRHGSSLHLSRRSLPILKRTPNSRGYIRSYTKPGKKPNTCPFAATSESNSPTVL